MSDTIIYLPASISLGEFVKIHRERLDLKHTELAEAAGVTVTAVKKIEKDDYNLGLGQAIALANFFGFHFFVRLAENEES